MMFLRQIRLKISDCRLPIDFPAKREPGSIQSTISNRQSAMLHLPGGPR